MPRKPIHGGTGTREFSSWCSMMDRCHNTSSHAYALYGAKGIAVCQPWHDFPAFLAYMGKRPPDTSLDRIDNSKGYEPGNVRWATRSVQSQNRAMTKLNPAAIADIKGGNERSAVLAARYGVSQAMIRAVRAGKAWKEVNAGKTIPATKERRHG